MSVAIPQLARVEGFTAYPARGSYKFKLVSFGIPAYIYFDDRDLPDFRVGQVVFIMPIEPNTTDRKNWEARAISDDGVLYALLDRVVHFEDHRRLVVFCETKEACALRYNRLVTLAEEARIPTHTYTGRRLGLGNLVVQFVPEEFRTSAIEFYDGEFTWAPGNVGGVA